jgi:hypothetical protein
MNVFLAIIGVVLPPIGLVMLLYCLFEHIDLMHEQNELLRDQRIMNRPEPDL